MQALSWVWVFNGNGGTFPSGVFTSREAAERWIAEHRLSGTLTRYSLDTGVYEWAIANKAFEPRKDHQRTPEFIQRFSSAYQEHFHYSNGA